MHSLLFSKPPFPFHAETWQWPKLVVPLEGDSESCQTGLQPGCEGYVFQHLKLFCTLKETVQYKTKINATERQFPANFKCYSSFISWWISVANTSTESWHVSGNHKKQKIIIVSWTGTKEEEILRRQKLLHLSDHYGTYESGLLYTKKSVSQDNLSPIPEKLPVCEKITVIIFHAK